MQICVGNQHFVQIYLMTLEAHNTLQHQSEEIQMSAHKRKNSIKKLASLVGVASASAFLSLPALAVVNLNPSSFNQSLNNRARDAQSNSGTRQFLAQSPSGTGGGATGTGAGTTDTGTGTTGGGATGTGTGTTDTGTGTTGGGATGTGTGTTDTGTGAGTTDTGTGTGGANTGGVRALW